MNTILIKESLNADTFEQKIVALSESMKKEIATQITAKLQAKTEDTDIACRLCDLVCLCAEKYSSFRVFKNNICSMLFRIEATDSPFLVAECTLIWKDRTEAKTIFPWEEIKQGSLDVGILLDKQNLKKYNELLRVLYTPVISGKERGLPFDYQIKRTAPPFRIIIDTKEKINVISLSKVEKGLRAFRDKWNGEHQNPLPDIGWPIQSGDRELTLRPDFSAEGFAVILPLLTALGECEAKIDKITVI